MTSADNDQIYLALLAVIFSALLSVLNSDGTFTWLEIIVGFSMVVISLAYWRNIKRNFIHTLAYSMLVGGGVLIMSGFFLDKIIKSGQAAIKAPEFFTDFADFRTFLLASIWVLSSLVLFALKRMLR
ncbi:MAG: hypothetical protein NW215_00990 [Hyphomicrobiales bacterium]|nr:hypothetical protein [Hyphomicrobiales bacterium]